MSEIKICDECGHKAVTSQWDKTKGKCPRCNPQDAKAYRDRYFANRPNKRRYD